MNPVITIVFYLICVPLFAQPNQILNADVMKLKITVGTKTFTATLYDNAAATEFKAMLPMRINMKDLNGNEKYFDLPTDLSASASNPSNIKSGDLMLYGTNTLVLFYKSFSTRYSYTPLGNIDDPLGLAAALGPGNVIVHIELEKH